MWLYPKSRAQSCIFFYPFFILYCLLLKWLPVGLRTCLINKKSCEIASSGSGKLAKFWACMCVYSYIYISINCKPWYFCKYELLLRAVPSASTKIQANWCLLHSSIGYGVIILLVISVLQVSDYWLQYQLCCFGKIEQCISSFQVKMERR